MDVANIHSYLCFFQRTFYIFAYCGLVVEISTSLYFTAKFIFFAPLPTSTKFRDTNGFKTTSETTRFVGIYVGIDSF